MKYFSPADHEAEGAEAQEIERELEQTEVLGTALGAISTGSAHNQWTHRGGQLPTSFAGLVERGFETLG